MESGTNTLHASPPALFYRPPQDLLVAQMHPVEVAEGDDYPAQSTTSALPTSPSSL
jgi:hypothetical protein